ncbi:hypothetical protein J6590_008225 [Homalodisca vitripennis]|nr:hypothetical protein J6590_008225 [Homalodisca vitripennis]
MKKIPRQQSSLQYRRVKVRDSEILKTRRETLFKLLRAKSSKRLLVETASNWKASFFSLLSRAINMENDPCKEMQGASSPSYFRLHKMSLTV